MSPIIAILIFLVAVAGATAGYRRRRNPAVVAPEILAAAPVTHQSVRDLNAELDMLETYVRATGDDLRGDPGAPARAQPTFALIRATVRERIEARAAELSDRTARAAARFTSAAARLDHALHARDEATAAVPPAVAAMPPRPPLMAITGAVARPVMLVTLFIAEANLTEPTFRAFTSSDAEAFWLSRLFAFGLVVTAEMTGRLLDYLTRGDHDDRQNAQARYWSSAAMVVVLNAMFLGFVLSMSSAREHNDEYTKSLKAGAVAAPNQAPIGLPTGNSVAAGGATPVATVPTAAAPAAGVAVPTTPPQKQPAAPAVTSATAAAASTTTAPTRAPATTAPPAATGGDAPAAPSDGSFSPLGTIALPLLAASELHPDVSFAMWAQLLFYLAGVAMVWGHARCGPWLDARRELRRARTRAFLARRRAAWCDSRLQHGTRPLDAIERRTRRIVTGELASGARVDAAFAQSAGQDLDPPAWPDPDDLVVALLLHANVQLSRPTVDVAAAIPGPEPGGGGGNPPEGMPDFPHVIADDFGLAADPETAEPADPVEPEPEPVPDAELRNGAADTAPVGAGAAAAPRRDRVAESVGTSPANDAEVLHGEPFQGGPEAVAPPVTDTARLRDRNVT